MRLKVGRVGVQGRKQLRQGCLRVCSPLQDSTVAPQRWDAGQNESPPVCPAPVRLGGGVGLANQEQARATGVTRE